MVDMLPELVIPQPVLPENLMNYQLPTTEAALLSWDFVAQQMTAANFYWLGTTSADGQPHSAPVWGVWYKNRLHFDGHPKTKWARNLLKNPSIAVHLPSAEQVVMIEGRARIVEDDEIDAATWAELDTSFQTKYKIKHGSPYWCVHPKKVIAWDTPNLAHMTRWLFG